MIDLNNELETFFRDNNLFNKGALSVMLVISNYAKNNSFPLNPDKLKTSNKGQVLGLGRGAVQKILNQYNIDKVLAKEGGRTSRGSLGNMEKYVYFLNNLNSKKKLNLEDKENIEKFWVGKIQEFFASSPFILKSDSAKSMRFMIQDLFNQAMDRQKEYKGTQILGTVIQHLVAAKLKILLGGDTFDIYGANVADLDLKRNGDFCINDVVIHVTSSPTELLISKCIDNIQSLLRPMIITTREGITVSEVLAKNKGYENRIELFDIEQFLASNLYEIGKFTSTGRLVTVEKIISSYNEIIEKHETDTSLKIIIPG